MEAYSQVQCGELFGMSELIHELVEHRYRKLGLHSQCIEMAKVDAKLVFTVLLLHQQDRRRK
jgi:hypothetical protein